MNLQWSSSKPQQMALQTKSQMKITLNWIIVNLTEEIGLVLLVDSYWGYLISHWLAILLIMVGFSTKPNAETVVCHWIMIWCWLFLFLTRIDVMYVVQDRWGLLADENRESLGAVNCVVRPPWHQIFLREKELKMAKYLILLHRPFADEQGKTA